MAKITYSIPNQNYELIRDKIGEILTIELPVQGINFDVWQERTVPFDLTELNAINVLFDNSSYDNQDVQSRRGDNQYFIDILINAKHVGNTKEEKGDVIARKEAANIAGKVAYILLSQEYTYLNLPVGKVQNRFVQDINIGTLSDQDSTHTIVARVTYKVKANEYVNNQQGIKATEIYSSVKLNETDKGFKYKLII